jgi:hypothetical protein
MKWKLGELDLQTEILFQFLDTPGDEVAPGSNEIGKHFENQWLGHAFLLFNRSKCSSRSNCSVSRIQSVPNVPLVPAVQEVQKVQGLNGLI